MRHQDECFSKLLRFLEKNTKFISISHKELTRYLDSACINTLIDLNILEKTISINKGDKINEGKRTLIVDEIKDNKVVLRDIKTLCTYEKPLDEYIKYKIISTTFIKHFSSLMFKEAYKIIELSEGESYHEVKIDLNGIVLCLLIQKVTPVSASERILEIARSVRKRQPILLVTTSNDFREFLDYFSIVPIGSFVYAITFGNISKFDEREGTKILEEIGSWIDYIKYVISLEDNILRDIPESELKDLLVNIDTNPKYLITALNLFRCIKRIGLRNKRDYELLEDLSTIALSIIYGGDPVHYGYKWRGKNVPDGVFWIWRSEEESSKLELVGLVDTKATYLKLSRIDALKYYNYIKKIANNLPWINESHKVVLFFISLDSSEDIVRKYNENVEGRGIKGFYEEISKRLKENEYIVFMPLDSLIVLVDTYLSAIRKIGLSRGKKGVYDIYRKILLPDPKSPVMIRLSDKLFCISTSKLKNYFEEIIKNKKWMEKEILEVFSED